MSLPTPTQPATKEKKSGNAAEWIAQEVELPTLISDIVVSIVSDLLVLVPGGLNTGGS